MKARSLIILFSYHHKNTEKLAGRIARVRDAEIRSPQQVDPQEVCEYDLVGFGSGIYDGKHHMSLLKLVGRLPEMSGRKAFIFSTNGVPAFGSDRWKVDGHSDNNHKAIREELRSKGFIIVNEFSCPGFNTNSFLKSFGGVNKGRPSDRDMRKAEEFAMKLRKEVLI